MGAEDPNNTPDVLREFRIHSSVFLKPCSLYTLNYSPNLAQLTHPPYMRPTVTVISVPFDSSPVQV